MPVSRRYQNTGARGTGSSVGDAAPLSRAEQPTTAEVRRVLVSNDSDATSVLLAQDPQRESAVISVPSGNTGTVHVTDDPTTDPAEWFPIAPGAALTVSNTGWLHAYTDHTAAEDVHLFTERY